VADTNFTVLAKLATEGARQFSGEMEQAAESTEGVGKAAETTSKKAGLSAKGLLKWAAAAGITYKAFSFFKGAINDTVNLAKATVALSRTTGLDVKLASNWAATAKERHISTVQLQRGFTTLGKTIGAYTKSSAVLFNKLGVSQEKLAGQNTEQRLRTIADGLLRIHDPLERAAIGSKLFGRSYLAMLPILAKGSKGIRDQEKAMRDSGATMDKAGVDKALKLAKAQRELDATMLGLKVSLGTALMPALVAGAHGLTGMLHAAAPLFKLFSKYPAVLYAVVGAVTAAYIAVKVYTAYTKGGIIITKLAAAAQWLWNAAVLGFPALLIIAAIAAVVVAVIVLYKKWGFFHHLVQVVWHWIKANWPLLLAVLLGPFAVGILLVIRHFQQLKDTARSVFNWLRNAFKSVADFITRQAQRIGKVLGPLLGPLKQVAGVAGKIGGGAGSTFGAIKGAFAEGGVMPSAGLALVGERGPELLRLPAGAQVTPMDNPAKVIGNAGPSTVVAKVYLDKRQIATAVAQVGADRRARR
jgi:hypothetical protein